MVDDKAAYTCRPRAVEVDGCDGGWVVRQEEVAVDSREHGNECQWRDAQAYAQRIECAHRSGLREQHDSHDKEGNGKEERILGDNVGNVTLEEFQVAVEESVAHPCNAEYATKAFMPAANTLPFTASCTLALLTSRMRADVDIIIISIISGMLT